MKKENIGRLLLSLLTAFVMVAGVFGAAVQTWSTTSQTGEESNLIADSVLDMETREIGDAPISASDSDSNTIDGEKTGQWLSTSIKNSGDVNQGENYISGDITDLEESAADDMIGDHGTRAATLDAGGPYGERPPGGIPHIEGDPVSFDATIDGGNIDDYYFRWEVTGDDNFDLNHFPAAYGGDDTMGVPDFVHQYRDNMIGEGDVQAWDGVSYDTVNLDGQPLKNAPVYTYWYTYAGALLTMGWQFDSSEEITIDELFFYDWYYPYQLYYIDIWDTTTSSKVATTGYLGVTTTNYLWNSFAITPVTLPAGNYIVSAYIRSHATYGLFPYTRVDPDDDIITSGNVRYRYTSGNSYPTGSMSSANIPMVDFHYDYAVQEPQLLEANCDIFVDNVAPIALDAQSIGEPGQEGSEIGFTGSLVDVGLDDDWQYRWDFGDGEVSDWYDVNKWAGGAKLAFLNALSSMGAATYNAINAELGSRARVFDNINIEGGTPTLETLMEYDAVLVAAWGFPSDCEALGDVLADYSDAGGGVVQCGGTFWPPPGSPPDMGVLGRWLDEEYNALEYTVPLVLTLNLGVYDSGNPIMQGVNNIESVVNHPNSMALTPYSYWVASWDNNAICVAATDEDHHGITDSGRIVGFNTYINQPNYVTGDALRLIANALMWASRQPEPYLASMPIPLDPVYHVYKDDHPTSVTPEDTFNVKLEVKDDDHERVVGGSGADWTKNIAYPATPGGSGSPYRVNLWNDGILLGQNAFVWCNGLGTDNSWMEYRWSSNVEIGGFGIHQFRPSGTRQLIGCVDMQYWTGSAYASLGGYNAIADGIYTVGDPYYKELPTVVSTTRFRLYNLIGYAYPSGQVSNPSVAEWEVFQGQTTGESYEMYGAADPIYTTCLIQNVWPVADNAAGVVLHNDENTPMNFDGFRIVDPAKGQDTEDFRYRWDFDDGTPVGPWNNLVGTGVMYENFETGSGWPWSPWSVLAPGTQVTTAAAHDGNYGVELDDTGMTGYAYRTDLAIGNGGDKLSYWARPSGNGNGGRAYLGFAASATGSYAFTLGYNTNQIIIHNQNPWGSFGIVATASYNGWQANKWYRAEIEFISTTEVTCRLFDSDGTTLLAEVSASGITGLPGGISMRGFYLWSVDTIDSGGLIATIPPVAHNFMDNGRYDVNLQLIDDDMKWDFSSGDPVFTGTGLPGDTEENWMSDTIFEVDIDNTDPVIAPRIRAYAQLDLSIRMSGTKTHEATMTLFENGGEIGYTEVTRVPGAPNIGVISNAEIVVTKGYEYEIVIVVDPKGDGGANPTWLFDMVFPDGKFKQFKHTFNDEHGWEWTISSSELKGALLGHDIIFEAEVDDAGSDDLAFVWNFGDSTPFGIHLYANNDQTTAVNAVSDEATVLFDQLGVDPDPNVGRDSAFDKGGNDIRTPYGTSIHVLDSISHVFDANQPYYYYVGLFVMDDDVFDDYPTIQLCPGSDLAFLEVDFR